MKEPQPPPNNKDRPFNPCLHPVTCEGQAFIDEVYKRVMTYEQQHNPRTRKRRTNDELKFKEALTAIVCDLTYDHLMGWPKRVATTRSKQKLSVSSRYRPWYFGEHIPDILDYLVGLNLMTQILGFKGTETTIKASDGLKTLISLHGLQKHHIGFNGDILETVVLKYPKEGYFSKPKLQEYDDTDLTVHLRNEVDNINDWIAQADLGLIAPLEKPMKHPVHLARTTLVRTFNCSQWCYGGRLSGGWWMAIRKTDRRGNVTINGELAIELDFGQLNPTLMYAKLGIKPPRKDLYEIEGFQGHRGSIKSIWNARLFQDKPMTRFPKNSRGNIPETVSIQQVLKAIDNTHRDLVSLFNVDVGEFPIGFSLMNQESNIMIKVLQGLKNLGIVALPIHDAVLVPVSVADVATEVMKNVFRQSSGLTPSITAK